MTTALLESPLSLFGDERRLREARQLRPARGRGLTLEELLDRRLRSAQAGEAPECPVCRARMHAEAGTARCSGCGSTLS
jgi:tRNA(Ile2) C34 agmatinyltransferase TiaS